MTQLVRPWLRTLAVLLVASSGALAIIHQTSANQPNDGIEFTLHIGDCSTDGDQKANCSLSQGQTFVVSVSLDDVSGLPDSSTAAIGVSLGYTGVQSKDNPTFFWPVCGFPVSGWIPGNIYAGCGNFPEDIATFTGTLYTSSFNCLGDGTVSLLHDPLETTAYDSSKGAFVNELGPDVLNIDCAPPTPTPTATPDAVGGVAFDAGSPASGEGFPLSARVSALVALALGMLGSAAWLLRRAA
jgi:hypothetical protein